MLPGVVSLAVLQEELPAALAWAARRAATVIWLPDVLEVRAVLRQRRSGELFYVAGAFGDYKLIAPAWEFRDSLWREPGSLRDCPAQSNVPGVSGSLFHPSGVICAPFNRLAYGDHGGPHSDWGGPEAWMSVEGKVRAHTVGDMLAAIARDLAYSNGRMG